MSNQITSREVARAALSWPFDAAALAPQTPREVVVDAIDGFRKAMIPANRLTKGERKEDQATLAKIIRSIGLRMRPDFSEDQARMWIASMVESLEDQPMRIAIAAARDALHHPMQFPGEVHGVMLEKAKPHIANYQRALHNLEKLLREIDAPRKIEASPEAQLMSDTELQEMPEPLRLMGINAGWLIETEGRIRWATQEEQDAHERRKMDERRIARA